ncbi:MAG: hypothetical protein Kow0080_29510 [Candidatus Promineifilaceae bacterium]
MNDKKTVSLVGILAGCGCLVVAGLLLVGMVLGAVSFVAFREEPAVETTTPSQAQVDHCRQVLAVREDAAVTVEWYFFQPGFLDDSLTCRIRVTAVSLDDVFDTSKVDPYNPNPQETTPGRFLSLKIENPEPGVYLITGYWTET